MYECTLSKVLELTVTAAVVFTYIALVVMMMSLNWFWLMVAELLLPCSDIIDCIWSWLRRPVVESSKTLTGLVVALVHTLLLFS